MVGVSLRVRATPVLRRLRARGVLALPGGADAIRFLPPLIVEEDHLTEIAAALEEALAETSLRSLRAGGKPHDRARGAPHPR
jgi:acetylornithine/succinyldiaminopimelate/putrescine aminotransferase